MSNNNSPMTDKEVEKEIDEIFKNYPPKMNPITVAMCFVIMSLLLGILLYRCAQSLWIKEIFNLNNLSYIYNKSKY